MNKENIIKFDMNCICGCTEIKFIKYPEDNIVCITQYVPLFYVKQESIWTNLLHRIRFALNILIGKEFVLYDLIVEDEKIQEFKNWASKI